ncbi:phage tail tape measure protein [Thalassolituus oleivorans]|uniref:Phage-related tail protein n=1 Tax=Thalassolituus oleivorans MIL-1 TaxID=1298593 RepID=M5DNC5_9GAMM|nr:phage tail tape measure protein [Thalassolituus oleivorans]CCU70941.1 phage-related tail protein [Thalassolituus oleivorans MIL-1]
MNELRTSVVIDLAGNLTQRAQQYGRSLSGFSQRGQRDLGRMSLAAQSAGRSLDNLAGRTAAVVAGAGAAYVGVRQVVDSAQLDKKLINIRQTAGATAEQAADLRKELFLMAQQTGQSLDSLLGGFNNLIQAGLSWNEALATTQAINPAMAVTGARAEVLSSALTVAAEAFDFDLSKAETSVDILDRMTKAGRLGNAELEDLSAIFARVGVNAKASGLEFDQTLGLIERLSQTEKNPERLATLVDSTLRIFTNQKYLDKAAQATGVTFYNAEDERRAALDVLDDIAAGYQKFKTDAQRDQGLSLAFGEVDLDTMRGLRVLLSGDTLNQARQMSAEIANAGGTIGKDLPDAVANSVDQVARLKSALKKAADGFSEPINSTIENAIKNLIDKKEDGGLDLTGGELLAGGAAGLITTALLLKGGGKLLSKIGAGVGAGVATGKVLEEMAGVQPVYVVNMPGGFGGMGGLPGITDAVIKSGKGGLLRSAATMGATRLLPLAAAGGAGYWFGSNVVAPHVQGTDAGNEIGKITAQMMAALGNKNAKQSLESDSTYDPAYNSSNSRSRQRAHLKIEVSDDRIRVKSPNAENMDIDVSGSSMLTGGA